MLDAENAPIVADICRRLDGIALAIELAAPRIRILTAIELRFRLDERFRVLTGGRRDALPRQQTLHATIAWSYDLLVERERSIFRRLGIFVGGFTIDGAIAVAGDRNTEDFEVLEIIASLADKSLLQAETDSNATRYRLLESMRAFALEKLDDARERDSTSKLHLYHYSRSFTALDQRSTASGDTNELFTAFEQNLEDIRAALDFGYRSESKAAAALLIAGAGTPWMAFGLNAEMAARAENQLDYIDEIDYRERALLYSLLSNYYGNTLSPAKCLDFAARSVVEARKADTSTLAFALMRYIWASGDEAATKEVELAFSEIASYAPFSLRLQHSWMMTRAIMRLKQREFGLANAEIEAYLRNSNIRSSFVSFATLTALLSRGYYGAGDIYAGIKVLVDLLAADESRKAWMVLAHSLDTLAALYVEVEAYEEALDAARESLKVSITAASRLPKDAMTLRMIAMLLAETNDLERAALIEGYTNPIFENAGSPESLFDFPNFNRLRERFLAALAREQCDTLLAQGAALTPEMVTKLALRD